MNLPVLLIEDDPDIRTLVEMSLKVHGIEVYSCKEGNAGLKAMSTIKFGLVILDVMMPDMSGYEVLQQINILMNGNKPPIALFTAKPEDSTAREAKSLGVTHILPKPFDPTELASSVKNILNRKNDQFRQ